MAFEYAIHANDAGAPVTDEERDSRQDWLSAVARFALTEVKEDVSVQPADGGGFVVRQGDIEASFDRDAFVAGVAGRGDALLDEAGDQLLGLGY